MEKSETKYKLFSNKILHETKDTETLVINLESGCYFILENVSSLIWQMICNQYSQMEILNNMEIVFKEDASVMEKDLNSLISNLLAENLIAENNNLPESKTLSEEVLKDFNSYKTPEVRKFTDMEALLLADPIHEFK